MIATAANMTARIAAFQPIRRPLYAHQQTARIAVATGQFIAVESVILSFICLVDLCSTLFWVAYRNAGEANPLMGYYLEHHGVAGFVAAKFIFLAMPLVIAEWARRHSPKFVQGALRFTICAYLTFYLIGVSQINGGVAAAARAVGIHNAATAEPVDDTGYIDPTDPE